MKYEKGKNIAIIFLMMLIVLAFSGCGENTQSDDNSLDGEEGSKNMTETENDDEKNLYDPSAHTCMAYSGYSCKVSEVCNAELYEATDVVICCSEPCEKEFLEVETFEPIEENEEELGEII